MPVWVSKRVWQETCVYRGASRHETSIDRRINEVIASCYDGMIKRLTQDDEFVFYKFNHWFWPADATGREKKKRKKKLGARLFLDKDEKPWLYIFDIARDKIDDLEKVADEEHNSVEL